jgi:hypothetical protein
MKQAFGLIRRPWGVFYLKNKISGQQTSLKTSDKAEAQRILQAHNESEYQPHFNLSLARVYLNGADPKLATRTWQDVMENIVSKKLDETKHRWKTAIKDKNFDCIRHLHVCETRPEHFDKALADGKVSSNVYLRRIHNHALGMEWLLKSVIPRLQWPKPVFKDKRAITAEEHAAIILREQNAERRDFYELLWLTGAAQSDARRRLHSFSACSSCGRSDFAPLSTSVNSPISFQVPPFKYELGMPNCLDSNGSGMVKPRPWRQRRCIARGHVRHHQASVRKGDIGKSARL